jgi:hypothetical protein
MCMRCSNSQNQKKHNSFTVEIATRLDTNPSVNNKRQLVYRQYNVKCCPHWELARNCFTNVSETLLQNHVWEDVTHITNFKYPQKNSIAQLFRHESIININLPVHFKHVRAYMTE